MVLTDDDERAARARYLTTQARDPGPEWIHREVGFNYRLTNLHAALGVAQLEQLDSFVDHSACETRGHRRLRVCLRHVARLQCCGVLGVIPNLDAAAAFDFCGLERWGFSVHHEDLLNTVVGDEPRHAVEKTRQMRSDAAFRIHQ